MKNNTDQQFYTSEQDYLRSSAIKEFELCSWLYYSDYSLKIPQSSNDGARMGTVVHSVFEVLLNPRHKKNYDNIIIVNSLKGSNSILELVWKLMKDNDLPETEEIYNKIESMILVGLKTNFFVENEKLIGSEKRFKYENESPKYKIFGTMDKIVETDKNIIIYDWKSSKRKYEGEDKESNIQGLFYSLASIKFWPNKIPIVRFVFLQFTEDPIIELSYDLNTLKGFEYYLSSVWEKTKNFSEKEAKNNFAGNKPIPKEGFSGSLACGYSKFKGHKNKEGKEYWHCPMKWSFPYYFIKENDKIISTFLEQDLYKFELKHGQILEKKQYLGCPIHNKNENNVLDSF